MQIKLFISQSLEQRIKQIQQTLIEYEFINPHPDLLYFNHEQMLKVEQAKEIRQFLSIKPYFAKGKAVAIESSHNLTTYAQNSLLKTLEEPPENTLILLGAEKESQLLPAILSRVEITQIKSKDPQLNEPTNQQFNNETIEQLINSSIEQRFQFIEKLEEKAEFLFALTRYYRNNLKDNSKNLEFIKKIVKAEEWNASNGNIRAILEYLMLELPGR